MKKDKSIKDLKQYNDKLKNQIEYSKIRVWNLERENEKLQQELQRKNNIINEIKELLKNPYNQDCINQNNDFLDKINELEGDNK